MISKRFDDPFKKILLSSVKIGIDYLGYLIFSLYPLLRLLAFYSDHAKNRAVLYHVID